MAKNKIKELRFRLWIDIDGERFFGPGRAELLQLIQETGSISRAAKTMGMSYKKAWSMIGEMNSKAYSPLVIAQKGGQKGGGTELTNAGAAIVKSYLKLLTKIKNTIDKETTILDLV